MQEHGECGREMGVVLGLERMEQWENWAQEGTGSAYAASSLL